MIKKDVRMYSTDDVLAALAKVPEGSAEDLASELTGLSIDSIWELSCREYIATNIEWETDGEDVSLPTACIIIAHDEDEATERLSDKYGWLIRTLDIKDFDRNGKPANYVHALEVLFDEGWNYCSAAEILNEVDVRTISDMELIALSEDHKAKAR